MTDDGIILQLRDVAPELTGAQLVRVRELLGDELPSADALAGLRLLLEEPEGVAEPG